MASGKIKWFDNQRGIGFIEQNSGQDVFLHYAYVVGPGFKNFEPGEEVTFDIMITDKGLKAQNVHRVGRPGQ
ncbi:MAG: cold shock domain-containing protein [Verrucomicrobia bacterium]|nr:cold shock domain-containing protein [Verrucomicrobiota bacterium]MDE3100550.1 cold shock domain-containing protein [Verrucomicrobiota bacterium]